MAQLELFGYGEDSAIPTIDGVFLPADPKSMIDGSWFSDVEILIGTTEDEGDLIILVHLYNNKIFIEYIRYRLKPRHQQG